MKVLRHKFVSFSCLMCTCVRFDQKKCIFYQLNVLSKLPLCCVIYFVKNCPNFHTITIHNFRFVFISRLWLQNKASLVYVKESWIVTCLCVWKQLKYTLQWKFFLILTFLQQKEKCWRQLPSKPWFTGEIYHGFSSLFSQSQRALEESYIIILNK